MHFLCTLTCSCEVSLIFTWAPYRQSQSWHKCLLPHILPRAAWEAQLLVAKPRSSRLPLCSTYSALEALMVHARLSTSRLCGRLPGTSGIAGCFRAKCGSPAKQTATLLLLSRDEALGPWLGFGESFETQDVWNKPSVIQQIGIFLWNFLHLSCVKFQIGSSVTSILMKMSLWY